MLEIDQTALKRLWAIAPAVLEPGAVQYFRVFVLGGGCNGLKYGFDVQTSPPQESDTQIFITPNFFVIMDAFSLQYLQGAKLIYESGLEGAKFKVHNPSAVTTCCCGSSFV